MDILQIPENYEAYTVDATPIKDERGDTVGTYFLATCPACQESFIRKGYADSPLPMQDIYKGMKEEITLHLESHKDTTPMQENESYPFTVEVLQLTRDREIVGKCFRITCNTCRQRNTKAVESLNSLVLQDAFEELCEEAKLHASSHDDTNYAE